MDFGIKDPFLLFVRCITKPIDCQLWEKLTKVKEKLEKKFDYSQPSMNFEHMLGDS
jgi:hypothetical protein